MLRETDTIRYYRNIMRLGLINAVVFFSVFAFSGFVPQAQSPLQETFKTELLESRTRQADYSLNSTTKQNRNFVIGYPKAKIESSCLSSLLYWDNVLRAKFKSYRSRILFCKISSFFRHFIIPTSSSEDWMSSAFVV